MAVKNLIGDQFDTSYQHQRRHADVVQIWNAIWGRLNKHAIWELYANLLAMVLESRNITLVYSEPSVMYVMSSSPLGLMIFTRALQQISQTCKLNFSGRHVNPGTSLVEGPPESMKVLDSHDVLCSKVSKCMKSTVISSTTKG